MGNIYLFSGPCGCGKTTLATAYAKQLVSERNIRQVYLIHGDDFHAGFTDLDEEGTARDFLRWEEILKFNWECIISVTSKALGRGLDVVIDYVIEDELPLIQQMAKEYHANVYYVVLTASEDSIRQRIRQRGDTYMIERALFLKNKLDHLPENQGHLFDNTGMSIEEELHSLDTECYLLDAF